MGWKPGKLLKKAFKGVRKVVKKIGKGIKKIAFKVFGAIGKLGPLGQLALMFIGVPPVISNFFGGIGGAITGALGQAGTVVSNFATKIAPNLTKGLGKAFNAIKTAGQGAFSTITEAIGNGVDRVMNFTKGKGFTLSGDRTSIFGGVSAKDIPVPEVGDASSIFKEGTLELKESTLGDKLSAAVETGGTPQSLSEIAAQTTAPTDALLAPDVSDITNATLTFGEDKVADQTLGEYFKELPGKVISGVTDTLSDPSKLVGDAISGGIKSGIGSGISGKITQGIMGDPPTQSYLNLGQFMTPTTQQRLDAATWNNINTSYQKAGSSFGAAGDAMTPYFTELANFDNDINYQRQMAMLNPTFNPIR